jgi:chromosome segregation ATPase
MSDQGPGSSQILPHSNTTMEVDDLEIDQKGLEGRTETIQMENIEPKQSTETPKENNERLQEYVEALKKDMGELKEAMEALKRQIKELEQSNNRELEHHYSILNRHNFRIEGRGLPKRRPR